MLRGESLTPVLDALASAIQVFLTAALCLARRREPARRRRGWSLTAALAAVYLLCWAGYDAGIAAVPIPLLRCRLPCGAFPCYGTGGKNFAALVPTALFPLLLLIYGIVNITR